MTEREQGDVSRRTDGEHLAEERILTEWHTPGGFPGEIDLGPGRGDMEVGAEPGPELRRTPEGGHAFAATREPEYETVGPDGRSAEPQVPPELRPALGAVTVDDLPQGIDTYPDAGAEGDVSIVAVFVNLEEAQSCADDLKRQGLALEVLLLPRRADGPEQGLRPGNVITGPGYGLSAKDQSPPKNAGMGAGVVVGATLGATVGALAATYLIPEFGGVPLVNTGVLVSTLVGAAIGSFLGGLTEYGAREKGDDATIYAGQVRHGGLLLVARVNEERADEARVAIGLWNPLEIRVQ